MTQKTPKHGLQTRIVQPNDQLTPGWESFSVPVARASTVVFPDLAAMRALDWRNDAQWRYGLHATPTSIALAQRLAALEGGNHALLQPSGLSSISNVYFGLVKSGDDVLIPDNVYSPNRDHAEWLAKDFGITARYYDPMIGAGIADLIQPNTKLIWLEAPGSVTMEVQDVPAIAAAAHAAGVPVALDNTYAAGVFFDAFAHGADIAVQALTKYIGGHSDLLLGSVTVRDEALYQALGDAQQLLGMGASPDDCSLALRGLQTLGVRLDHLQRSTLEVARWLQAQPRLARVRHPALPGSPGHEIWQRDFTGSASVFSVEFDAALSQDAVVAFIDRLRLFKIGYSWGGAHSLVMPYRIQHMRKHWTDKGILVRFNVGLEDVNDLMADIERAFGIMQGGAA